MAVDIDTLSQAYPCWLPPLEEQEKHVALSTTVTLSRNFSSYNFPPFRNHPEQAAKTEELGKALVDQTTLFRGASIIPVETLLPCKAEILRHRIGSHYFMSGQVCRDLIWIGDLSAFGRINNQNHIEFVFRHPGCCAFDLVARMEDLADEIKEKAQFAQHKTLGYLQSSSQLCGSGIEMRVPVHIPAIQVHGWLKPMIEMVKSFGFTVVYDVALPTKEDASIVTIKNATAMEHNPLKQAQRLDHVIQLIKRQELVARQVILGGSQRGELLDVVGRAFGLLRYAYCLSEEESRRILSCIWLAHEIGILPFQAKAEALKLFGEAFLIARAQAEAKGKANSEEGIRRAEMLRKRLCPFLPA